MKNLSLLIAALACLAAAPQGAVAQTFYGNVVGSVQDSTGAVIPGASVTLTNLATGEQRAQETEASGLYRFVNLVPGQYRLEARSEGFKQFAQEPIVVEVEASIRIDPLLEIGEVTEVVEVVSSTPLLQSQTSSLGQVVESRKVTETPLNGRNVLNLVALAPGVVPQGQSMQSPTGVNIFAWGNYQIGGGQSNQSATTLDGAPVNIGYANLTALVPTQDAVQEFKIQTTNNLGAEFGRFGRRRHQHGHKVGQQRDPPARPTNSCATRSSTPTPSLTTPAASARRPSCRTSGEATSAARSSGTRSSSSPPTRATASARGVRCCWTRPPWRCRGATSPSWTRRSTIRSRSQARTTCPGRRSPTTSFPTAGRTRRPRRSATSGRSPTCPA